MSDRDWADRFSRDVDGLLCETGRMESEQLPGAYRQTVDLARTLAATDFSSESQVRQSLRRRLLERINVPQGWQQKTVRALRSLFEPRNPALRAAALIISGFFVVMLVWPGASATLAQSIRVSVQQLVLGQHTTVTQTTSPTALATESDGQRMAVTVQPISATPMASSSLGSVQTEPEAAHEENLCIIHTAIGRFGFNVPSGRDAVARRFGTFEEAQEAAPFSLRNPGYLPAGYALREALIAPDGSAFLFFDSPDSDIILVQILVEGGSGQGGDTTVVEILTSGSIEPVMLNGQPAGWIEGHGLMWEAGGVSYTVGGGKLDLDEAIRIAESLE